MNFSINFFVTSVLLGLGLAIDGFLLSLTNGLNYKKTTKIKTILSATIFALFQLVAVIIGWFCVAKLINNLKFIEDIISIIALIVLTALGTKMLVNGAKNYHKERISHNNVQNKPNKNNTMQKVTQFNICLNKSSTTMQTNVENNSSTKNSADENNKFNNKKNNLENINFESKNESSKDKNFNLLNNEPLEENKENLINTGNSSNNKGKKRNRSWFGALLFQGLVTSVDALSVGFVVSKNTFISALITAIIISFVTFTMYLFGFTIGKKFGERIGSKAEILGGIVLIIIGVEIFVTSLIN